MTSPIPPHAPKIGKPERRALSPATKIFAASTTMLIGTALAVTFWKSSLDQPENPLMDRLLVSAPLPGDAAPPTLKEKTESETKPKEADKTNLASTPLPVLEAGPAIDSGNVKYAQAYPPPILPSNGENAQKKKSRPNQTENERKFVNVQAEFKRIHKPAAAPAKTKRPNTDFSKGPDSISTTEISDALLPLFHEAENLKPLGKARDVEPENPFSTPAVDEPTVAVDLKPLPSGRQSLKELKPLPKK